jgi:hypothetical protein
MQDSDERMERLYRQLVPFGVCCNIVQTNAKPQEVKKLDPRSVPGIIVGMGTSTKHYRVMVLGTTVYKIHIARHVVTNAQHFAEYFSRTCVVPELRCFTTVCFVYMLSGEPTRQVPIPEHVSDVPMVVPCMAALPTHALSRGSVGAGTIDLVNEVSATEDSKPNVSIKAEASEDDYNWEDADDYGYAEEVPEKPERERSRERSEMAYSLDQSIRQVEPRSDSISLDAYDALPVIVVPDARLKWLKLAHNLQVSPVCNVMCDAAGTSERTEEERVCAGRARN